MPIVTYASETWTLTANLRNKLLSFEMACLISRLTLHDRVRNEVIPASLNMENTIIDNIKTRRLRYFGHVNRRPTYSAIYQSYKGSFTRVRPQGRPPSRWSDQIRADTNLPLLTAERNTMDRKI